MRIKSIDCAARSEEDQLPNIAIDRLGTNNKMLLRN